MKRLTLLLFIFAITIPNSWAKDNISTYAHKQAKKLTKEGWLLLNTSALSLEDQLIAQWEKISQISSHDSGRKSYLAETQIIKAPNLQEASDRARTACYAGLATMIRAEVKSLTTQYSELTSKAGESSTHTEFIHTAGSRSQECLQNIEPGLALYRKTPQGYEVQATYLLCTDRLYQ